MKYLSLLAFILFSCGHYGPIKKETGIVIEKQYFPYTRQTVTGTGFSSEGGIIMTSHSIDEHEKYMVVFKCSHGVVFSVNESDVYGKVDKGDEVIIDYQEYLNKKGNKILDLKFLDANKL